MKGLTDNGKKLMKIMNCERAGSQFDDNWPYVAG
jgi:hypothetical protein